MAAPAPDWLDLWYQAAAATYGIVVSTDDIKAAKAALYRARAAAADPSLEGLQLRTSPDDPAGELWIVSCGPKSTRTA